MTAEILVNVTPRETRAAVVENGVLQEVYVERTNRRGITSNIYKGRVSRTLPGMQAAFIDIGLERTAFLHVSDIAQPEIDGDTAAALPRRMRMPSLLKTSAADLRSSTYSDIRCWRAPMARMPHRRSISSSVLGERYSANTPSPTQSPA